MIEFPRCVAGVDFLLEVPKLTLPAHEVWRRAHERGLVSDEEWGRYEALIEGHPFSWKGWLKWAVRRPRS